MNYTHTPPDLVAAAKVAPPTPTQIKELKLFYLELIRPQLPMQPATQSWREAIRSKAGLRKRPLVTNSTVQARTTSPQAQAAPRTTVSGRRPAVCWLHGRDKDSAGRLSF